MPYPGTFSFSLCSVQHQCFLVCFARSEGRGHHGYDPPPESLPPELLIFRLYGVRQFSDVVSLPVPPGISFEVVREGVELR